MFTEPHGQRSACFVNVASATFTGNVMDALCRMLRLFPAWFLWMHSMSALTCKTDISPMCYLFNNETLLEQKLVAHMMKFSALYWFQISIFFSQGPDPEPDELSLLLHDLLLKDTFRLCGLVVRVPGNRSSGPGFDSRRYQIFWEVVSLERGPLSLLNITEELLEWKSSGSGTRKPRLTAVGILCVDHATPSIRKSWH
jgi:hypothetical protein